MSNLSYDVADCFLIRLEVPEKDYKGMKRTRRARRSKRRSEIALSQSPGPEVQASESKVVEFEFLDNPDSPDPAEQTFKEEMVQYLAPEKDCACLRQMLICGNKLAILRVNVKNLLSLSQRHHLELLAEQLYGLQRWHYGVLRRPGSLDPDIGYYSSSRCLVSSRKCADFEQHYAPLLSQLKDALVDSLAQLNRGGHLGAEWMRILAVQQALPKTGSSSMVA